MAEKRTPRKHTTYKYKIHWRNYTRGLSTNWYCPCGIHPPIAWTTRIPAEVTCLICRRFLVYWHKHTEETR